VTGIKGDAPDFVVIGAAKSGTTSLAAYLDQHPRIAMSSIKEARFLGYGGEVPLYRGYGKNGKKLMRINCECTPSDWEGYQSLFSHAEPGQIRGESSPAYLYEPCAPAYIFSRRPDARLIAILRNPVERAYSSYLHLRRENAEPLTFLKALEAESARMAEGAGLPWRYVDLGRYTQQLERYRKRFSSDQMLVLLYDDMRKDPVGLCRQVYRFLNVDDQFIPDVSERYNLSGEPRIRWLYDQLFSAGASVRRISRTGGVRTRRVLKGLEASLLKRPSMEPEADGLLREVFKDEIEALSALLDRDLTGWLE
jgi:hypothetical protein